MFCKNCGQKIAEEAKFCKNCGTQRTDKINTLELKTQPSIPTKSSVSVNISGPEKVMSKKWWVLSFVAVIIIAITIILSFNHRDGRTQVQSVTKNNNTQSVVDIWCDNGKGGSGTIFTSDGTVLTNNHVITGSVSCQVTIPNPATGGISEIYDASPVIVPILSKKYDVATLKINGSYTDSKGKTWGTYPTSFPSFILPSTCSTTIPSQLGDPVRIYGYPVTSGGYNLTITDGIISSFADDGSILTSAQIDSGNSGGLAVDQNGCWLGIPSAVVSGNYQNLGVVIPGSVVVENFLNNVPAKLNPVATNSDTNVATESAITPQETNNQQCQDSFGDHSVWSGKMGDNGKPTCLCQKGYSWDATGNTCATQTSLQKECQTTYGVESYSYTQKGKAVCGCKTGYQFNDSNTSCVATVITGVPGCLSGAQYSETTGLSCSGDGTCAPGSTFDKTANQCVSPLVYCQNHDGSNATYNPTDNTCGCMSGYVFDSNNICTLSQTGQTGYQVCANMNATWDGSSYTNSGGFSCTCNTGYTSSNDGKTCVAKSGYQVCSDAYPHETWDGTYSSTGKYNCVCQAGYTWDSYSQSCY